MASQARTSKPKPLQGVTARLAEELRGWLAIVPDEDTCTPCRAHPDGRRCPIHQRKRSTVEALREVGE